MASLVRQSVRAQRLIASSSSRSFSIHASRMANKPSSLDGSKGSVGSAFQPDGKVGQVGEKVGGPFSSDGAVGKQFTEDGAVGGTAQEAAKQMQGEKKPVFDKDGAIGKQFQADGAIGSAAEAVGGPFSKDGAVGKQFTDKGAVGGTVQENLGSGKK